MGEQLNYAKALLSDIEALEASTDEAVKERLSAVRAELDRVKDEAVAEAHALLGNGAAMTATSLENGQAVPSTARNDVEAFLGKVGAEVPAAPEVDHGTDPLAPSIVDGPLAANPANLVAGDGTDPVKTPPVVTPIQDNGVATVVAPSAPEGDLSAPAPVVTLDASQVPGAVEAPAASVPSPAPKPGPAVDAAPAQ